MIILTTDKWADQYILHYKVLPGTLEAATCFRDDMECYSSAAPAKQIFPSRFVQL